MIIFQHHRAASYTRRILARSAGEIPLRIVVRKRISKQRRDGGGDDGPGGGCCRGALTLICCIEHPDEASAYDYK